jgi:hypothetical protein
MIKLRLSLQTTKKKQKMNFAAIISCLYGQKITNVTEEKVKKITKNLAGKILVKL